MESREGSNTALGFRLAEKAEGEVDTLVLCYESTSMIFAYFDMDAI